LDPSGAEAPASDALRWGRAQVTHDNDVRLLVGGHEALPRLLDAIAQAEHSIHIEVMLFFNDDAGYQVRDALLRRIDETGGRVKVRILYDYLATSLGDPFLSKGINPFQLNTFMAPLRGAGAQVVDSSLTGDKDPERLESFADFIPPDLQESILNFPYEVRHAYRRMNAKVVELFRNPKLQRPIERFLGWAEKHEHTLADQVTPHRLVSRLAIHDHRKLFVFDGDLAFCGGMNIGQEYLYRHPFDPRLEVADEIRNPDNPEPWPKWHDTCCELRGPVVNTLQALFLRHFQRCGGSRPEGDDLEQCFPRPRAMAVPQAARSGGMKVAVATTIPGRPSELEREAVALMQGAEDRILLRNPYTIRPRFIGALSHAAKRGLTVRALTPDDHNDSILHRALMRTWYPYLEDTGAEVREYRNHFTHTKALTVDGQRTLLGSFNYNNRSSILDFECGIVVDDATFATETERRLYHDDVESGLTEPPRKRPTFRQSLEMTASLAVFEIWATFL
jgi:cardiolipin synthase